MDYEDKRNGFIERAAQDGSFGWYLEDPITNAQRIEIIGQRLVNLRRKANMAQKEVCDIIGVAPQTYSGYEKGKHEPSIETLVRLSHLYQVSIDYITGRNMDRTGDDIETIGANIADNDAFIDIQRELQEIKERVAKIETKGS